MIAAPIRVVSRAEEKEHRKAEAQLGAKRANAAFMAALIEENREPHVL